MITKLANHGLHVIQLHEFNHHLVYDLSTLFFYPQILHASTLSFLPPLWAFLCTASVTIILSLLYPLSYQSTRAFFGAKVLFVACETSKLFGWPSTYEKELLANQCLSKSGSSRVKGVSSYSIKES